MCGTILTFISEIPNLLQLPLIERQMKTFHYSRLRPLQLRSRQRLTLELYNWSYLKFCLKSEMCHQYRKNYLSSLICSSQGLCFLPMEWSITRGNRMPRVADLEQLLSATQKHNTPCTQNRGSRAGISLMPSFERCPSRHSNPAPHTTWSVTVLPQKLKLTAADIAR